MSESNHPEVVLSISYQNEAHSLLEVSIIDNGCGIADRKCIVDFFTSEIRNRNNGTQTFRSKGKYGVGLTTCLLYSQLNTGFPIR
jgi:DNA topoisomerase VI subunit B